MSIRCEFCQSGAAEICLSCFESGRSQAPDASYARLVATTQALVGELDKLAWLAEENGDWFHPRQFPELDAVKRVLEEVF